MAIMRIWSGSSADMVELPSPVSVTPKREIIWSEDTGRAQSGSNQAEMVGTAIDEKMTYDIKWGVLSGSELNLIVNNMPKGFFYFGVGTSKPSSPNKYYRSELAYDILQAGSGVYYKDVAVSVIQK